MRNGITRKLCIPCASSPFFIYEFVYIIYILIHLMAHSPRILLLLLLQIFILVWTKKKQYLNFVAACLPKKSHFFFNSIFWRCCTSRWLCMFVIRRNLTFALVDALYSMLLSRALSIIMAWHDCQLYMYLRLFALKAQHYLYKLNIFLIIMDVLFRQKFKIFINTLNVDIFFLLISFFISFEAPPALSTPWRARISLFHLIFLHNLN